MIWIIENMLGGGLRQILTTCNDSINVNAFLFCIFSDISDIKFVANNYVLLSLNVVFFAFLILLLDHKSQLTHCTCNLLTYFININNNYNNNYMLYFLTKIFTIKENYQYE